MKTMMNIVLIGAMTVLGACGAREPGRVQGGAAAGAATGAMSDWSAGRSALPRGR